jgi:hypothetical protein
MPERKDGRLVAAPAAAATGVKSTTHATRRNEAGRAKRDRRSTTDSLSSQLPKLGAA